MDSSQQPITERPNPLSTNIDIFHPVEVVSTLQACDEEIFNGWQDFPGIRDERIQRNLCRITDIVTSILQDPSSSTIIFSGCGTSGRLGFMTARTFNGHLRRMGKAELYDYIMAGGDKALFTSQEAVEDDPILGAELLEKAAEGKSRVLFFGITCGLSAPFVAGQLHLCLNHLHKFTPVLIGFNPAHQARNSAIENWDKTFLQVVQRLEEAESKGQGFLLNPVVGPEPITGSSRMKSGTATKLLLETVLVPAHAACFMQAQLSVQDYFLKYKEVWQRVYQEKPDIAALLKLAGASLKEGGHLYYVGGESLGILGLIDASECPPTYGATLDDVRGFLDGGYSTLGNVEGDLSSQGKHFQISWENFRQQIVPTLTDKDLVIFISKDQVSSMMEDMQTAPCQKAFVVVNTQKDSAVRKNCAGDNNSSDNNSSVAGVVLDVSDLGLAWEGQRPGLQSLVSGLHAQLAVKWTLNAVSTGAHLVKGKVFNNVMVDLRPSNVKLFHRAVGIIQHFSQLPEEECREYLLRSLYHTDDVSDEIRNAAVTQHISVGATTPKVVPTALLAALSGAPIATAQRQLQQQPVLRHAFAHCLSTQD